MAARKAFNPVKQLADLNRLIDINMARLGVKTDLQLAAMLGMNRTSLSKRRTGEAKWTFVELCRLFRVLEFGAEEVVQAMGAA